MKALSNGAIHLIDFNHKRNSILMTIMLLKNMYLRKKLRIHGMDFYFQVTVEAS